MRRVIDLVVALETPPSKRLLYPAKAYLDISSHFNLHESDFTPYLLVNITERIMPSISDLLDG